MARVVAFGGSILAPTEPDPDFVARVATTLDGLSQDEQLFVVVGGGAPARQAIEAARRDGVPEDRLDRVGIAATRLNAQVLLAALDAAGVPCNDDVHGNCGHTASEPHRVVVMGGTTPGHSTDYVAAELALAAGASDLVVATNVDGVYTADPRSNPEAERVTDCTFAELAAIVGPAEWKQAGQAGVVDPLAVAMLTGKGVTLRVVDGNDLANLEVALTGKPFSGTTVADA